MSVERSTPPPDSSSIPSNMRDERNQAHIAIEAPSFSSGHQEATELIARISPSSPTAASISEAVPTQAQATSDSNGSQKRIRGSQTAQEARDVQGNKKRCVFGEQLENDNLIETIVMDSLFEDEDEDDEDNDLDGGLW